MQKAHIDKHQKIKQSRPRFIPVALLLFKGKVRQHRSGKELPKPQTMFYSYRRSKKAHNLQKPLQNGRFLAWLFDIYSPLFVYSQTQTQFANVVDVFVCNRFIFPINISKFVCRISRV